MRPVLLAFLTGLALPAAAEPGDHVPLLAACLKEVGEYMDECIGVVSNACTAAEPGGDTRPVMAECQLAEAAAWQDVMEAEYARGLAWAEAKDAERPLPDGRRLAPELAAAQAAWQSFFEAECRFNATQWAHDALDANVAANCRVDLIAERAIRLTHVREW